MAIPIPYNSQAYAVGTVFTPSTTTSKKITLKGVSVKGNVNVAAQAVTSKLLTYEDPTYTWASTDTISKITAIVNPMTTTRSIDLTNPAAPVVHFQVYAEGFKNANSTGKLTQTFDVAVTLNLGGSTLTLDSTFNPFINPSTISAAVIADPNNVGKYIPTINFTIHAFSIGATGTTDVDVMMAIDA